MKVGNNIKKLREFRDITQKVMAASMNLSVNGYSKIERDEVEVTLTKLAKIAELLDVSIGQILQFDGHAVLNLHNSNYTHGNVQEQHVGNDEMLKQILVQQQTLMQQVIEMMNRSGGQRGV
jgi:transcriptional regulator with XRE-family HTH domain